MWLKKKKKSTKAAHTAGLERYLSKSEQELREL